MGVHGLWELLAPVGRRVSVETLAGKKLAIDASIWMIQFMKAMRDEKGEMVRNAHLLGFFRRICKLLFLRTKPVFVFDGGTPALKRRTVIARRRQRENAQAKIRKMAEKLLLNHLKSMRLKELAKDLESQREKNNAKGKKVLSNQSEVSGDYGKLSNDQEKVDEMLAASLAAEEEGRLVNALLTSNAGTSVDEDEEIEEIILPEVIENLDPAILEALPPELVAQMKGRSGFGDKGKQVLSGKDGKLEGNLDGSDVGSKIHSQEELDEILSASLAAEEGWKVSDYGLTSDPQDHFEAEDHEADEEMIIPEVHGNVDRDVLDSLPISMRLDLLAQMRERQMAENRQKYQKMKKAPEKFSELQIQSYLKAISLRREINQVQKAAAGQGVGGVQTSRIASEANRKFIFSSTFSGNKEILASSGAQTSKSREDQSNMEPHSMNSAPGFPSTSKANSMKELIPNKSKKVLNHGVETFVDERGRVRVSRVRAMGIRMTRDLQRNLELMKEIDQDLVMRDRRSSDVENAEKMLSENNIGGTDKNLTELSYSADCSSIDLNGNNRNFVLGKEASIQISFEDDGETKSFDEDDQIFASLVAEKPLTLLSAETVTAGEESSDSESIDWQEGEGNSSSGTGKVDEPVPGKSNDNEESDVEWEEGFHDISKDFSSYPDDCRKKWKGDQEEDADLQEAIRRSLEEEKSHTASEKDMGQEKNGETNLLSTMFVGVGSTPMKNILPETAECAPQVEPTFAELDVGSDLGCHDSKGIDSVDIEMQQEPHKEHKLDDTGALTNEVDKCQGSPTEQDSCVMGGLSEGELMPETTVLSEKEQVRSLADASAVQCGLFAQMGEHLKGDPCDRAFVNSCGRIIADDKMHKEDAVELQAVTEESCLPSNPMLLCSSKLMDGDVGELKVPCSHVDSSTGKMHSMPDLSNKDHGDGEGELTKENLEEEIQKLDQEYIDLGNEQKKLERTAESVNSEMFTECQELLQMFGLPYIIAPMEAEAQCAYMELANLVDGVVTDDSDVFLFGARSVYKNIFDDRKYVETYFMKDIEKELGLTREKLIHMALLLGSDYTEGISGIGIVNAIEVVNAFPEENGLKKFREWVESPDPSILGKGSRQGASALRKRGSNTYNNGKNISKDTTEGLLLSEDKVSSSNEHENLADQIDEMKEHFMNKHRNVSKNWHIPANFPCEAVISAYTFPQVDKSTEPFSWGRPDHYVLRKLCWEKFGWGSQKADELLVPVLNEYNKHQTQLRLEAFYSFNERFAKIRSKRIKQAVKGITGSQAPGLMDDGVRKVRSTKKQGKCPDQPQSEKSKVSTNKDSNEAEIWDPLDSVENTRSASKPPGGNSNCRGRGRGRKEGVKTRKRKAAHVRTDTSSSDGSSNDDEDESLDDQFKGRQVRKSARTRKQVCYIENEVEEDAFKPAENCCDNSYDVLVGSQDSLSNQGTSGKNMDCQHHKDADSLLRNSPSTDYLKMGGGFCLDEDDSGKQQLCSDDGSLPGTCKGRNFETDGDLCMDEATVVEEALGVSNEAVDDAVTSCCLAYPDYETRDMNSVQSACTPWFRPDESHDHMMLETSAEHHLDRFNAADNDSLTPATSLQEDKTKENSPISYGALRAMPFLKRKKRKM